MKNEIMVVDWTAGPHCMTQVRNPQRAKALKKELKRQKRTVMAMELQGTIELAERLRAYAGELIVGAALLFGPLLMMGLLCGTDIIP